jgi:Tfp pilus assembly protein PilF
VVLSGVPLRVWGDNTCGAGALSTVLNYFQNPATEDQLNEKLKKGRHGGIVSVDLMIEARNRGFDARLVRGTTELVQQAVQSGSPPILMLRVLDAPGVNQDLFHYIVVDGYDPERKLARMQFGDGKERWASLATSTVAPIGGGVEKAWEGTDFATLIVEPRDPHRDDTQRLRTLVLLEESGRLAEARTGYLEYLKEHPDSALAATNLGNVEVQLGSYSDAETAYRNAIRIDAQNRDALNNLAWVLMRQQRLKEAEEMARRAAALPGSDSYLVFDTLGQILLARENCADAINAYTRGLADVPPQRSGARAPLLYGMGVAQNRCGRRAEARVSLESALKFSPDAAVEKQIREELARTP